MNASKFWTLRRRSFSSRAMMGCGYRPQGLEQRIPALAAAFALIAASMATVVLA